MSSSAIPNIETAPLFDIEIDFDPATVLGKTPQGFRSIVAITGGSFEGPDLRGEVLAGGGDWVRRRSDGAVELDVRITLRTDDGALIYMAYPGLIAGPDDVMGRLLRGEAVDAADYYLRTAPRFETGADKYDWLNRIVAVGSGALGQGRISYRIHRVL